MEVGRPARAVVRLQRVAGTLAAAAALAAIALVDAWFRPVPSLMTAVGQAFIRITPGSLNRAGVEAVGTADKPLVAAGTVLVPIVAGLWVGPAAARRPWVGPVAFAAFGLLGLAAAISLPLVSVPGACVAAVAGVLAGTLVLRGLLAVAPRAVERAVGVDAPGPRVLLPGSAVDRRRFLLAGTGAAAGTVFALGTAELIRPAPLAARQRAATVLPPPADPAQAAEPGLTTEGLSPLVTPTADFYRIDEALVVPAVDVRSWRLDIDGLVDRPLSLSYDDLLEAATVERHITLACVSNEIGGDLVGTARWQGVRLASLLEQAGIRPDAGQLVGRAVDGFTVGFPTSVAIDGRDALVAIGMNGEPLPLEHGFPARLVVPGLYGYVSATKWLRRIELTTWDAFDAYWVDRGWAKEAPIKVQSRIDVPGSFARLTAGRHAVAGVAWAPHAGIAGVELDIDGTGWQQARLGPSIGTDAWRQWVVEWDAAPGDHDLSVRATTLDGEVQTDRRRPPFPDGATGHHRITVRVS